MFEDALAGVAAGRAGGFGLVVGVDRHGHADALREAGRGPRRLRPVRAPGMTTSEARFAVEPWSVRETSLDPRRARAEPSRCSRLRTATSACAANLDEGEPFGVPGTYLNSFYELRPLPYAEAGYGYPSPARRSSTSRTARSSACSSTTSRSTSATASCSRTSGCSTSARACSRRTVEWISPAGAGVRVRSTRLVSFVQRAAAAILYEVEPLDGPVRVVVQSELVANEPAPSASRATRAPPRRSTRRCGRRSTATTTRRVVLVHSTRRSELRLAAAMDHVDRRPGRHRDARRRARPTSAA